MIFTESLRDSETLMKDYKKSNPAKNNFLKKSHAMRLLTHSLVKVT